jgi:hypothetical protein
MCGYYAALSGVTPAIGASKLKAGLMRALEPIPGAVEYADRSR